MLFLVFVVPWPLFDAYFVPSHRQFVLDVKLSTEQQSLDEGMRLESYTLDFLERLPDTGASALVVSGTYDDRVIPEKWRPLIIRLDIVVRQGPLPFYVCLHAYFVFVCGCHRRKRLFPRRQSEHGSAPGSRPSASILVLVMWRPHQSVELFSP